MLPLQLLRVRTRKEKIAPQFCLNSNSIEMDLANKIIIEFEIAVKRKEKKDVLQKRVESFEAKNDYKLVRGLFTLLERRCVFKNTGVIDSAFVRRAVFEESSKKGFALTDFERSEIISKIASSMNLSIEEIENAMWSDFEENMLLEQFNPITTEELIAWYNLSLMQTLLFNCTKLDFYVSGGVNWKRVLRDVKRFGMMYHLESAGEELVCSLDGPLSLFKMTDKYGTSIAKLLPSIVASERWRVKAWVVKKTMSGKKIYEFELSSEQTPPLLNPYVERSDEGSNAVYDSSIEEKFANKFEQFANGWKITREPDPIIASGKALIPDFLFEKYNRRVYLEIVGFWTKEYLERKMQKLIASSNNSENNKNIDMLIAVNEELACSKLSSLPREKVIFYKNEVPVKPVTDYLKKIDQEMIEHYGNMQINIDVDIDSTGEVIPLQQIAQKYNIPEESLLKTLSRSNDYVVIGKFLVAKIKVHKMEKLLDGITKFIDACSVLSQHKIPESCHAELISVLGYDVVWQGLDVSKATIIKKS